MTLNDFLYTLDAWLAHEQTGATVPGWHIQPDPLRRRAESDQILIGVGVWGTQEKPVTHDGVCLNNKGLAGRFSGAADPATVTELVLNPPPELAAHWRVVWGGETTLDRRLSGLTVVVEDAAPDAVLAYLFWLAVVNGVAAAEFRRPEITHWIEAVRRWELTGMVAGDPHKIGRASCRERV